jgi:diguanylate cyclase (GGDEF)-like protein/PAS domain S-box-containing protein
MHVPIIYRGRPLGVLSVNNHTPDHAFTERDDTILTSLADYAAIAIVNANSFEQAQREIRMREQIAVALRESEERYALAVRGSNDGLWDWDLIHNKIYFSPRWKQILGFQENELGSNPNHWFDRIHKDDLERTKIDILTHIEKKTSHFINEHRLKHKDDTYIWVLCRGLAVWDSSSNSQRGAVRIAGSMSDITDRKKAEERLLHDAFHDALTGLPNRALFMDRLNHTLERTKRNPDYQFAVLFMDLDNFKDINDSIGHLIGDKVLIKVAETIQGGLRSIDTLARFGGDEFIILMEDVADISGVIRVTDWINKRFETSIIVGKHEISTSASIGIVLGRSDVNNAEEVIRNADIAMYSAKAKGRARAEIFEPSMRKEFLDRITLESDLRKAVTNNEFIAHYQPIVVLETGELVGFEALVRWQHPFRGLLHPGDFISVAEETGLIIDIDHWVLQEACHQMKRWNEKYAPSKVLHISINISGKHITDPELFKFIKKVLEETQLDPRSLKLEITELTIVDQNEFTVRALSNLRDMGVQIQIDDFGIGYSSLSYLSRFPINALKIDQSFIGRIVEESSQRDIVKAIVTLTDRLNVNLIAEGVETIEQMNELQNLGCELGQGYYLSHPLEPGKIETILGRLEKGLDRLPTLEGE